MAGYPVKVCAVPDLSLHKVISDRARDQKDVRFLVGRYRGSLDRGALDIAVAGLADLLAKPEMLARYRDCWK